MPASSQASTSKNKEPFKRTTKNSQRAGVIEEDILGALGRAKKSPADRARLNEQNRTESILQARLEVQATQGSESISDVPRPERNQVFTSFHLFPSRIPVYNLRYKSQKQKENLNMTKNKEMPHPAERGAPKLETKDPEGLIKFFKHFEIHTNRVGGLTDKEKIRYFLEYAEEPEEAEWRNLPEAAGDDYDAFKEAILSGYGGVLSYKQGSIEKLDRIVDDYSELAVTDFDAFHAFLRAFNAEGNKLLKGDPPKVQDRDLVTKFLRALEPGFRTNVINQVSLSRRMGDMVKTTTPANPAGGENEAANPENEQNNRPARKDKYKHLTAEMTLNEVIDEARALVEITRVNETNGSGALYTTSYARKPKGFESSKDKEDRQRLDIVHSHVKQLEKDMVRSQKEAEVKAETRFEALQQSINELVRSMGAPRAQVFNGNASSNNGAPPNLDGFEQNQRPPMARGPPGGANQDKSSWTCYFCGAPGHYLQSCEIARDFIDKGLVKWNGNKLTMPDGSQLPRYPSHLKMPERIMTASKRSAMLVTQPGILPMVHGYDGPMSHHAQSVFLNEAPERDAKDDLIESLKAQLRFMEEKSVRPSPAAPTPPMYPTFQQQQRPPTPPNIVNQYNHQTMAQTQQEINGNQVGNAQILDMMQQMMAQMRNQEQFVSTRSRPDNQEQQGFP